MEQQSRSVYNGLPKNKLLLTINQIKTIKRLKFGVWLYLLLLIFEGSLRKWVLPGLSNVLLIVRDPIAIWLLIDAANFGIKYANSYTKIIISVSVISIFTAIILGHGNFTVAIYGARITILHFPLVFLIGKLFTKADVLKVGKFIVWLTIPMTILLALQFYSPQTSWVNRGVGGNLEGAGFSGTEDYFRPPGTFSFTNGNTLYYSFAAPFILFFTFHDKSINKLVLTISIFCLLLAVPLSISRSLFFSVVISVIAIILSFGADSKNIGKIVGSVIGIGIIFYFLSSLEIFKMSLGAFTNRFTTANEQEGGLESIFIDRFLGGMIGAVISSNNGQIPFFGVGIGKGTNVGAQLLVGNSGVFLVSEGEWGRIIGELGVLLGFIVVLVRTSIAFSLLKKSFVAISKSNVLPWILMSFAFLAVLQGNWSTPTSLGFFVVGGGFALAAFNTDETDA